MPDIPNEERVGSHVKCAECSHIWIGFYLPMPVSKFAAIATSLRCPMCASNKVMLSTRIGEIK